MPRTTKSEKIAELIRTDLLTKRVPKDSPVYSVRKLAAAYDVSTTTADRALDLLAEDDLVYRREKSGTYVKNTPPEKLRIVCAVTTGSQEDTSSLTRLNNQRVESLCRAFQERGAAMEFISYPELKSPELAARRLDGARGLLISSGFLDSKTESVISAFQGHRVVYMHDVIRRFQFPCSQVVPDFAPALRKVLEYLAPDERTRFTVLTAEHDNAYDRRAAILDSLDEFGIPLSRVTVFSPWKISNYESEKAKKLVESHWREIEGSVVFTTTEYIAQALLGMNVRVVSIDNLEVLSMRPENAVITSIDGMAPQVAETAAKLLCDLIERREKNSYIIGVPADLYLRKTTLKSKGWGKK